MISIEDRELLKPKVPWRQAYPVVEAAVRDYFDHASPRILTTAELTEALWPVTAVAEGWQLVARHRVRGALIAMAKNVLAPYVFEHKVYSPLIGKKTKQFMWRRPEPVIYCPHCGGEIKQVGTTTFPDHA